MKLGIVGHGADKFNAETRQLARLHIRSLFLRYSPDIVCSGRSPVGGIDIWAEELSKECNIPFQPFPAEVERWDGSYVAKIGYKQRNLQIAAFSDTVVCIVAENYLPTYKGRVFNSCYHCIKHVNAPPKHVKSGGCWTAWNAKKREWIII